MMFPTISRRSLLTEMMTSRRTLYIEKKKSAHQSMCHANHVGFLSYRIPIFTHGGPS